MKVFTGSNYMGEGKQLKDKVQLVMGKVIFHYNHHWDKR
jgi:hypothetical protein